jgi:hypothetical protein
MQPLGRGLIASSAGFAIASQVTRYIPGRSFQASMPFGARRTQFRNPPLSQGLRIPGDRLPNWDRDVGYLT